MILSRSLHGLAPLIGHHLVALMKPGFHLSYYPNFRSPLCVKDLPLLKETPQGLGILRRYIHSRSIDRVKPCLPQRLILTVEADIRDIGNRLDSP
jgi:hypothetical protein